MKLGIAPAKLVATNTGANADRAAMPNDAAIVISSPLTTAALTDYVLSVFSPAFDPKGDGSSIVLGSVRNGSNSAGVPDLRSIQVAMGVATVTVRNNDAAVAFNGTLIVSLFALN